MNKKNSTKKNGKLFLHRTCIMQNGTNTTQKLIVRISNFDELTHCYSSFITSKITSIHIHIYGQWHQHFCFAKVGSSFIFVSFVRWAHTTHHFFMSIRLVEKGDWKRSSFFHLFFKIYCQLVGQTELNANVRILRFVWKFSGLEKEQEEWNCLHTRNQNHIIYFDVLLILFCSVPVLHFCFFFSLPNVKREKKKNS